MSAGLIVDSAERAAALDPSCSYIVQAPAGSGKTGLLIQRVLRLLAIVDKPEEILAITFTRKAAAEMRRRVLEALEGASGDTPPESANARVTWQLARAALARDRQLGWDLVMNAARIRIQTIDSLCASLARQMPVLSGIGAPPSVVDKPQELYREAAERTLSRIESEEPVAAAVRRLLVHLDGDWSVACSLLEIMLARRDQWLGRVVGFEADARAREALEQAFRGERARIMQRLRSLMPDAHEQDIANVARFAAGNLATSDPSSLIARLAKMANFPSADEDGADDWCGIAKLLLVADKVQFRKTVNVHSGFPPGDGVATTFKKQMISLLERLTPVQGLGEALHAVRCMPPPSFTHEQWEVLSAVIALLPRAAAELQVVFAERGEIDFPGLAQGAVRALGEDGEPTDLMLALDVRLKHLLVDEFQDTSRGQWDLLTRLTAEWSEGDGRTVFLVGDPMQSIYRFREADVALFLRARREGLPSVALTGVKLATNFRSQQGIVAWVNDAFAKVLSPSEDADSGAVPYSLSSPHHPQEEGLAVTWHPFVGRDSQAAREAEAERVAEIAAKALAENAEGSVAILVRNRTHLDHIVPALKRFGVRFRAVDIEPLGGRQIIQDLLAVTRALAHPADRIAWLSILRAPWAALTVSDLHALTEGVLSSDGARLTIWELLNDDARLERLNAEGRESATRVREILAPFVSHRLRGSLRERVEGAWLALGGPACAERDSDLEDAETFFDQLDEIEEAGDLVDPAVLEEHLAELYASPDVGGDGRLQVMTIHKAKGLEFGTVIVPGLDRLPRSADRPLFAWKARADGTLMMAPVRAAGEKEEPAYDYLCELEKAASEHEVERLLYVAATRAEKRLHLLGFARFDAKKQKVSQPSSRSLLGKAWSVAWDSFESATPMAEPADDEHALPISPREELRRLDPAVLDTAMHETPGAESPSLSEEPLQIEFSWVGETARHVGTITHRWLQRIATEGLDKWNGPRVAEIRDSIARELARRGVPPVERDVAAARVVAALDSAIVDQKGRWVLASYPDAKCEYRLRVVGPEGVRLIIIDRLFTDESGKRWVVDYKTGGHEGADLESFLDRELERYGAQLTGYAAAFTGALGLGLYFPLVKGWRERRGS
jgi:ATP-dependent helicase/nuclease subunit A